MAGLLSAVIALMPVTVEAAATSEGIAYRLDDGTPAYRETHLLFEMGGMPAMLVLYRCMDGSAFARKVLVERSNAVTPDFDFLDGRTGYREGVRATAAGREVYWQKSGTDAETHKPLVLPANAVIDAGFDSFVRTQWTRFTAEQGVSANFLLPSALRFFKVRIEHQNAPSEAGVNSLRMKLDTWYGFAAPDTHLKYRTSDRRLLQFKGIGTIRDTRGRNQAVRIEFPGGLQGRQANVAEIETARHLPLTGRCGA